MESLKIKRYKFIINNTNKVNDIIKILEKNDIDVSVLEVAYEKAMTFDNSEKDRILYGIVSNNNVSKTLIEKIIFSAKAPSVISYIIKKRLSPIDSELLNSIINFIVSHNYEALLTDVFSCVHKKLFDLNMLKKIVCFTNKVEYIYEILFGCTLTEELLINIFKYNQDNIEVLDLLLKAIDQLIFQISLADSELIDLNFLSDLKNQILEIKNSNESLIDEKIDEVVDKNNKVINYKVEIEDNVTERLRRNVEDGMSTMMWGLSGVGKTSRVSEVDPDYTMIKLKNDMLPEEVTGGKEPNGLPGEVYPPKWYVKLCEKCEREPDKMHILFIDELTNVKNNVKSLVWEIIEDRRVNGDEDWKLPDNCAIVAAGNRPEESTSVITDYNGGVLPEPLHDRFDFHIEIPLDMKEWQKWALETDKKTGNLNIHPSVLSFCVGQGEKIMFSSLDVNDATKPRLSPRRWAKLSKAIYMAEKRGGKNCHVSNQRIAECIGSEIAPAFIAHYEKEPIDMKKVENGDYNPEDFKNIDDKLFALSSVLGEYNGSELAIEDFIETCLGEDYLSIYKVMKKQRDEVIFEDKKDNGLNIEIVKSGMKKIC